MLYRIMYRPCSAKTLFDPITDLAGEAAILQDHEMGMKYGCIIG